MSGSTAQDGVWKSKETSEEARYIRQKEAEQLAALQTKLSNESSSKNESENNNTTGTGTSSLDRDFEGGYGGQEDLEDRYATTYGAH